MSAAMIGGYRVLGPLGEGASGTVVRALDEASGRAVAIKVAHTVSASDPTTSRRFDREARALATLDHPNVVKVLDVGHDEDGRAFVATELLEGETLEARLRRGALDPDEALALGEAMLAGLGVVHRHDLLHRDLKPQNLFCARGGDGAITLKLIDFGLAKRAPGGAGGPASVLTQEGAVLGTPGYMAPEQAFGGAPVDARADVYAAGAILFELFAGRPVFVEDDPASLLRAHVLEPVPPLSEARSDLWCRPELDAVLAGALHKEPGQRFRDAAVLSVALSHVPRPVARLVTS